MRTKLNDSDMDKVVGGTVIISKDRMIVGFDTLGEKYSLKNCTYREARDYRDDLIDSCSNMSNSEFDKYCKKKFKDRGWI